MAMSYLVVFASALGHYRERTILPRDSPSSRVCRVPPVGRLPAASQAVEGHDVKPASEGVSMRPEPRPSNVKMAIRAYPAGTS